MVEIFADDFKKEMTAKRRQIQIPNFMLTHKEKPRKADEKDSKADDRINTLTLIGLAVFGFFTMMYDENLTVALIGNAASGLFTAGLVIGARIKGAAS